MSFAEIENNISNLEKKRVVAKLQLTIYREALSQLLMGNLWINALNPNFKSTQSAVLGMHNIVKRPVIVDDNIEIRPIMYLALSYDHRIVDGKEAVSFLKIVKGLSNNLRDYF